MAKEMIFGIDLGTTNSALAVFTGKTAEIIKVDGRNTFPSVVTFKPDGNHITGRVAYVNKGNPDTVFSAKTNMGTDYVYHLTLEDGSNLDVTPVQVAAEVLRGIITKCDKSYGVPKKVVITVPAYFNAAQREDTLTAAKLAGLEVMKLINEPVAGALSYGLDNVSDNEYKEILVLDVGGGTTDVTKILVSNYSKVKPPLNKLIPEGINFNIIATGGNNHLGGDDYDRYTYEYIVKPQLEELGEGHAESFNKEYPLQKAIAQIEGWKSLNDSSSIRLQMFYEHEGSSYHIDINKEDFEISFKRFWEEIKVCIDECLSIKDTEGNVIGINKLPKNVVLIGGSTKNPKIVRELSKMYEGDDIIIPSPAFADESVALGAAVQGAILNKELGNIFVKDVNPLPIGVESAKIIDDVVIEGNMEYIIPKDCAIPTSKSFAYSTVEDNQKQFKIAIYQGTSKYVKYNNYIGDIIIDNLPEGPAGTVGVIATLSIDFNGVLTISAHCNGEEIKSTFKSVLLPAIKELTVKDKNIITGIKSAISFIKATGKYTEALDSLESWEVGTQPPIFLKEHAKELREFTSNLSKQSVKKHIDQYSSESNEFEEVSS